MRDVRIGRRAFVQGALVAGMLPISSWAAASSRVHRPLAAEQPGRLHKLLVDRTIPESVRLGAYAGTITDEVFEFGGDLTRLWNEELRLQWRTGPRPIAGLTSPNVLMVLEQLGRDHDARIVFRAEHRKVGDRVQHRISGCDSHIHVPAIGGVADWVGDMARQIADCPHDPALPSATLAYETGAGPGVPGDQQRLVTWILVPVARPDSPNNSAKVS